jgi:NaMN:DMB phosphoribosyltransferase
VIIWPEHLANRSFLDGVDQKALALDYKALTGRDLPVTPAPTPTPTSGAITAAQNSANLQLAVTARAYLRYPHSGINDQMAQALKPWLQAWGL